MKLRAIPFTKRKTPVFEKWPEKFLVELVKAYERAPGESTQPGFGLDSIDLAVNTGIVSQQVYSSPEYLSFRQGDRLAEFDGVQLSDIYAATSQNVKRKWVEVIKHEGYPNCLVPTPKGIDHAHRLMRPVWIKVYDAAKGDFRNVLVSLITAVIAAILTTLIIQILD